MAANILCLPFRRTHPVQMSTAIRQYISTKYDQHPDMFTDDMEAIDKLRADAVNALETHASGVKKITLYAAQLVWISGKFPIDIGVDFTWYPALGFNTSRPISQNNLRFELANVLYNLASLYSQLAVSLNRSTSDGLKSAYNYFCLAAGVISHIKSEIIPDMRGPPPEDMDIMTLESIEQLLLAQGQECFWSRAVKEGMKDGTIAKLAAKVSDFYDQAAEYGQKSDTISTEWIHHMTAKHHHFAAAAQYRASRECLEQENYGEEVARLRDSIKCVNEALKEARWINKIVLADLNGLKSKVTEDLKRAEKDNDILYLVPVPAKSELTTLGRRATAEAKIPEEVSNPSSTLGDGGKLGQPLFARLVPYAVHIAASIYEERRNRLVNSSIIEELETMTQKLRDLLQSLNLPGSLQALEKPLGLPPSLTSHAEEIRQQDGLHNLRRSMRETATLRENDVHLFQAAVEFLRSEAAEDDRSKLKHGTDRWMRPPSKMAGEKLYAQVNEIDGYLKSAANSDDLVKGKLKDCEKTIQVLSGSDRDLESYVPNSRRATMPPNVERAAYDLRVALNEVSRQESRRKRQIEKVREKAKYDDINQVILPETARLEREFPMQKIEPAHFEDLFEQRLRQYDEDKKVLAVEAEAQSQLSEQIKDANTAFNAARAGDNSTREREKALQRLENAYNRYREIQGNINTGREFYNNLAKMVTRFRDQCKEFAYQRRLEAGRLEDELLSTDTMASLNLKQAQANSSLQDQKNREKENLLRNQYSSVPGGGTSGQSMPILEHQQPALTAPVPTRANVQPPPAAPTSTAGLWSPEAGINFSSPPPNAGIGQSQQQQQQQQYQPQQSANTGRSTGGRGGGGQWDATKGIRFG